jgi:hypothetical protein
MLKHIFLPRPSYLFKRYTTYMKKVIIFVIIIGLLSWGVWAAMKPQSGAPVPGETTGTSTTTPQTSGVKTYTDPQGAFTFHYPAAFTVSGRGADSPVGWSANSNRPGQVLAKAYVDRTYLPQTNFSEAWFTVGTSQDTQAIAACLKNTSLEGMDVQDASFGGHAWKRFTSADAGAGNYYETTEYRAILDGDCYSLAYTIHSTNLQNYSPEQGIKEFNKAKVVNDLEGMVKSFTFLVNSD